MLFLFVLKLDSRVLYTAERRLVSMIVRVSCSLWKMCSWLRDEKMFKVGLNVSRGISCSALVS